MLLVLTGAAISLVTSVVVIWAQARHIRKGENRVAARESTRQLTGLFIAEREGSEESGGTEPTPALAEAEMASVAISDRRTRERMRTIIRLLRELSLPELQELSGAKPAVMRPLLCDHALEVLGAHFRNERLPALPPSVQKMLDVEDEALSIHAGGAPRSVASAVKTADTGASGSVRSKGAAGKGSSSSASAAKSAPAAPDAESADAPAPRGRIRRKSAPAEEPAKPARRSKSGKGADQDADTDDTHSAFWNDDD
ncbi:hypothetical protein FZ103_09115 [Streptomonospora sp. PA3]|uniref:hypothetical protein n=1 Tax=Streptomonospora sp. PA3 TaxID=2607326 RepID=UPI0012DF224C|nr:hypothetical protein [Streptomonospora sp. PA3]MUL41336.1 hypothetical protein [Streptomonospora sp. PA3]